MQRGNQRVMAAGGRLVVQYRTKKASYPKCPVTGQRLPGIKALRPQEYSNKRMSKRQKTVNRIYGGCLSHNVVRERIMRAFLVEEQKIVKKVCCSPSAHSTGVVSTPLESAVLHCSVTKIASGANYKLFFCMFVCCTVEQFPVVGGEQLWVGCSMAFGSAVGSYG